MGSLPISSLAVLRRPFRFAYVQCERSRSYHWNMHRRFDPRFPDKEFRMMPKYLSYILITLILKKLFSVQKGAEEGKLCERKCKLSGAESKWYKCSVQKLEGGN